MFLDMLVLPECGRQCGGGEIFPGIRSVEMAESGSADARCRLEALAHTQGACVLVYVCFVRVCVYVWRVCLCVCVSCKSVFILCICVFVC